MLAERELSSNEVAAAEIQKIPRDFEVDDFVSSIGTLLEEYKDTTELVAFESDAQYMR